MSQNSNPSVQNTIRAIRALLEPVGRERVPSAQQGDFSPPAPEAVSASRNELVSKGPVTLPQMYSEPCRLRRIIDPGTPEGEEELRVNNSHYLYLHIIDPGTPEGKAELSLIGQRGVISFQLVRPVREIFQSLRESSLTVSDSERYSEEYRRIIDPGTSEGQEELASSHRRIIDPSTPEGEAELPNIHPQVQHIINPGIPAGTAEIQNSGSEQIAKEVAMT